MKSMFSARKFDVASAEDMLRKVSLNLISTRNSYYI